MRALNFNLLTKIRNTNAFFFVWTHTLFDSSSITVHTTTIENVYVVQSGDSLERSAIVLARGCPVKRTLLKALTSFTSLVNTHKAFVVFSYSVSTFSRNSVWVWTESVVVWPRNRLMRIIVPKSHPCISMGEDKKHFKPQRWKSDV